MIAHHLVERLVGVRPLHLHQIPLVRGDDDPASRPCARRRRSPRPDRRRPAAASSTSTTTSAREIARRASITLSASTCPDCATFPGRRMPAVSTMRNCRRCHISTASTASRVVPGISETIIRSSRSSRLTSDDLPAFGRPTIATAVSAVACSPGADRCERCCSSSYRRRSRSRPRADAGSRLHDLVEQIADALSVLGAHLDDRIEAELIQLERTVPRAPIVGLVDRENRRARWRCAPPRQSPDRQATSPSRPSTTNTIAAADAQRPLPALEDQRMERILGRAEHPARVGQFETVIRPRRPDASARRGSSREPASQSRAARR